MNLTDWRCKLLSKQKEICPVVSLVTTLWAVLSLFLALLCTFAFLRPFWLLHPDNVHTFGLWNRCIRRNGTMMEAESCDDAGLFSGDDVRVCQAYGEEDCSFSTAWQAACDLCGGCCVALFISTVMAFWCLFTSNERKKTINCKTGMYLQIAAESMLCVGLLVYPFALGSPYFQYYCGDSKPFHPGHCRIGGAYILAILCACLGPFCIILGWCTDIILKMQRTGNVRHPLV